MNSSSSDGLERYQTHEPENLQERYAHRAAHMKPSEIRSYLQLHPDLKLFHWLEGCRI